MVSESRRVREIFEAVLDLSPSERIRRLDELDAATRTEVESLLRHLEAAGDFLDVSEEQADGNLPFDVLGGVRLTTEIGHGGTGTVYRGIDTSTDDVVALKLLFFGLASAGTGLVRFEAEAERMRRFDHPSLVPLRRSGTERGTHYLVMPFVEGSNLADEMVAGRRPGLGPDPDDPRAIADFVARIADGLAHAHDHGVIHRDVKPANVLIDRQGHPRLTDFGLARDLEAEGPTRSGDVTGTIQYMSPEQLLGRRHEIDHRTDVYSLGVVLYELLTGRRPFLGDSALDVARDIRQGEPTAPRRLRPDVPRDLQTICLKAMEKKPDDRYVSIDAMARDLRAFARGGRIETRPPSALQRARRFVARRRRPLAAAAILLLAVGVAWWTGASRDPTTRTPVVLTSEPSGTRTWVRPWNVGTGEYDAPLELGTTPVRTSLDPGLVRFVFAGDDGALAELSREIPPPDATDGARQVEFHATLVDTTGVLDGMVRIPGGRFVVEHWPPDTDAMVREPWTGPVFAMDRTEVTIGDYLRFHEATGHPLPKDWEDSGLSSLKDRPMVMVSWTDARAYAEWAGKRLPTLKEFQRTVGGTVGNELPWTRYRADVPPESLEVLAVVGRRGDRTLAMSGVDDGLFTQNVPPVGSHPSDRSEDGVLDLLGSVQEWIDASWRTADPETGRLEVDSDRKIAISAGWTIEAELATTQLMLPIEKAFTPGRYVGFRCVRSLDPLTALRPLDRGPSP